MTRTKDGLEFPSDYSSSKALGRIAAALERLAGAPPPYDFSAADAFVFAAGTATFIAVPRVNRVDIALLHGIDQARDTLLANTERFAQTFAANNALLWGARGMGKSALIKAAHATINARLAMATLSISVLLARVKKSSARRSNGRSRGDHVLAGRPGNISRISPDDWARRWSDPVRSISRILLRWTSDDALTCCAVGAIQL